MINDVKTAFHRSSSTILQDAAGATALIVILIVGLHLPNLI